MCTFFIQWVNFYILDVLKRRYDAFLHFWNLFKKSKKLKLSPTTLSTFLSQFTQVHIFIPQWTYQHFGSIHICAHLSSKWVNLLILLDLKWKYDSFLHFRKLFLKKWKKKKMKFSPTVDLSSFWLKNVDRSAVGENFNLLIFWKVFENEEKHNILTSGQLKY